MKALLAEDEACTRRLDKLARLRRGWKKKMELRKFMIMIEMLEKLALDDMDMEIEEIEVMVMELMEYRSQEEEEKEEECKDEDGDQVMKDHDVTRMDALDGQTDCDMDSTEVAYTPRPGPR